MIFMNILLLSTMVLLSNFDFGLDLDLDLDLTSIRFDLLEL